MYTSHVVVTFSILEPFESDAMYTCKQQYECMELKYEQCVLNKKCMNLTQPIIVHNYTPASDAVFLIRLIM